MTTPPGRFPDPAKQPPKPADDAAEDLLKQSQAALDNQREGYGKVDDNDSDVVGKPAGSNGPVRNDT